MKQKIVPNTILREIPYKNAGELERNAKLVAVDFPIENLSDSDIKLLNCLRKAVEGMNPIFMFQWEPLTSKINSLLDSAIPYAEGKNKEALQNYRTLVTMQNSPYSMLTHKSNILDVPEKDMLEIIKKTGNTSLESCFTEIKKFFYEENKFDKFCSLYPKDITDEEFDSLGEEKNLVTSLVVKQNGKPKVIRNEEFFRKTLWPVIDSLEKCLEVSKYPALNDYIKAKINELKFGGKKYIDESDIAWIKNDSPVDFILSTGLEVYLDAWKAVRGSACGLVMAVDGKAKNLFARFVNNLQALENDAPYKYKTRISKDNLPNLKMVNVLSFSGEYIMSPLLVGAQSLPNDEVIAKKYGSVNMVYKNIGDAATMTSGNIKEDFFVKEFLSFDENIDASTINMALHELGHKTGRMSDENAGKHANELIGEYYNCIEECRAELFSMYSVMHKCLGLEEELQKSCYIEMFVSIIKSLSFEPKQVHQKARNMMYHYFKDNNAFFVREEGGIKKFGMDFDKAYETACRMLGEIGDIKSSGNKDTAGKFVAKYCHTDELQQDIKERMQKYPLGTGIIFPKIVGKKLVYPEYEEQDMFKYKFLD